MLSMPDLIIGLIPFFCSARSPLDILKQIATTDDKRLESRIDRALERAVFDLDRDVAGVAGVGQAPKKAFQRISPSPGILGVCQSLG